MTVKRNGKGMKSKINNKLDSIFEFISAFAKEKKGKKRVQLEIFGLIIAQGQ